MNFVIISRNFYPQKDAEAYCTTRFASALANAGHSVHVVTAEYPSDGKSYEALLHPAVKLTRVKTREKRQRFPYVNLRQLMVLDDDMANVPAFCRALRGVLCQYDKPILISRALPMTSLIVGWRCRKLAYKWIAHFSDPIPWFPLSGRLVALKDRLMRFWIKRTLRDADAISVTCQRAIRYYRETFPEESAHARMFVTTHIGDHKLDAPDVKTSARVWNCPVIMHSGDMYYGRGNLIFDAIERLNDEGLNCVFVQDRAVHDKSVLEKFKKSPHSILLGYGGGYNGAITKQADVSFVPDFERDFTYSPYLMSKFVYQVYTDRPIVVLAKKDSAKHDYCVQYPMAGLFFAESGNLGSLVAAIKGAVQMNVADIDRRDIRKVFSEEVIADEFIRNVIGL